MTMPSERYNAIKRTEDFLKDLLDPKKTPRVPKNIRRQAYYCLRHYPHGFYLDVLATKCPDIIETPDPIDPLTMMIAEYEK